MAAHWRRLRRWRTMPQHAPPSFMIAGVMRSASTRSSASSSRLRSAEPLQGLNPVRFCTVLWPSRLWERSVGWSGRTIGDYGQNHDRSGTYKMTGFRVGWGSALLFQSSTINLFRYLPPLSGARTCPSGQVRANALILQWSSSWAGKRHFPHIPVVSAGRLSG